MIRGPIVLNGLAILASDLVPLNLNHLHPC